MDTKAVIRDVLATARYITTRYLEDLTDEDLLVRPAGYVRVDSFSDRSASALIAGVDQPNCVAWQLGHLIVSENSMIEGVRSGSGIALQSEFIERHGAIQRNGVAAGERATSSYLQKAEYIRLREKVRQATLSLLDELTIADFSLPGPLSMRAYAPTVGAVMLAIGNHEMMHSGQLAVVRRLLGKAVVI